LADPKRGYSQKHDRCRGRCRTLNDATKKRLISILSTAIAFVLASRLAEKLIEQPEVRGVRDDVKEALLQAGFSLISTIIASILIRQLISNR
jgi:uncharacterized membrane protein